MFVHIAQKTTGANLGLDMVHKRALLSVSALADAYGPGDGTHAEGRKNSGGLQEDLASKEPFMASQIGTYTLTEGSKAAQPRSCATIHDKGHDQLYVGDYSDSLRLEAHGDRCFDEAKAKFQKIFVVPDIVQTMPIDALPPPKKMEAAKPRQGLCKRGAA